MSNMSCHVGLINHPFLPTNCEDNETELVADQRFHINLRKPVSVRQSDGAARLHSQVSRECWSRTGTGIWTADPAPCIEQRRRWGSGARVAVLGGTRSFRARCWDFCQIGKPRVPQGTPAAPRRSSLCDLGDWSLNPLARDPSSEQREGG